MLLVFASFYINQVLLSLLVFCCRTDTSSFYVNKVRPAHAPESVNSCFLGKRD